MRLTILLLLVFAVAEGSFATTSSAEEPGKQITFKKTKLDDKFRSEGASIGDFNHDGKMDISAGNVYYAAPDWKLTPIVANAKEYDPHGYSESFCNYADDVNGDGRTDLIVVGFPGKETWWHEQPAEASGGLDQACRHANYEQRKPRFAERYRRCETRIGSRVRPRQVRGTRRANRRRGRALEADSGVGHRFAGLRSLFPWDRRRRYQWRWSE